MNHPSFNLPCEDEILSHLVAEGIWVGETFFSPALTSSLFQQALQQYSRGEFRAARVGRRLRKKKVTKIRSDEIRWIEDWGLTPELAEFRRFVEALMVFCRRRLFIQAKRYEGHFAIYEKGSFYKRHIDQHERSRHRQLSCVYYLSPWQKGDGGELKIYPKDKSPFLIAPQQGRLVLFISHEIEHEVLPAKALRVSLTGWVRDDEVLLV